MSPSLDSFAPNTLFSHLTYTPQELKFGTSGRRGEVVHLSQLEIYLNVSAELRYLQSLPRSAGGIVPGDDFYFGYDLRPSSSAFVPEQGGRGRLAQTIDRAIRDAGMTPLSLGYLPTPALTFYALGAGKGSIMITGSHIPFDRNGYKLNTSIGELLKEHEQPITEAVERERRRLYAEPFDTSLFDERGFLKSGSPHLPPPVPEAEQAYLRRYIDFFGAQSLSGLRLLVYQHSAVGRDLLVQLLEELGADVVRTGRSTEFVPIDTENIDALQLQAIQRLVEEATVAHGAFHAVISTDGDSDRPLILGIEDGQVRFFAGDLVGMVVAAYLRADAVVVPISCNDAIDTGSLASMVQPKTRIGSPFVITGMEQARQTGKKVVCGWEANGGFLLGSDVLRNGQILSALPTRDAFLPIVATLASAREQDVSLHALFSGVNTRFSRAGLLKNFPRPIGLRMVQRFSPAELPREYMFPRGPSSDEDVPADLERIRREIERFFTEEQGFAPIAGLNYVDGVRVLFTNGEIAHLRPSGNADELRMYAVADTEDRATQIVALALAEPDGILRQMEKACS